MSIIRISINNMTALISPGEVDNVGYGYDSIVQGINDVRRIVQ